MKTAISIPDELFERAEQAARRLRLSRSELFARAIAEFLTTERTAAVRSSYDEAFADAEPAHDVRFRRRAAHRLLASVEWSEE